jgi:outer membrane protein TolC
MQIRSKNGGGLLWRDETPGEAQRVRTAKSVSQGRSPHRLPQTKVVHRRNGLFDESKRMAQSAGLMKRTGILLAMALSGFSTLAQVTNLSTVGTNYSSVPVPSHALAATNTPVAEHWMSLQDCIEVALKHNFTIQIARYNPQIARYNLWGSYGVYDPVFNASYEHSYNLSPGGVDEQGRPFSGVEADTDFLQSGLAGVLPWGTAYSLGVSASDQTGTRPSLLTSTNITGFSTNIFYDAATNPIVFLNPTFASRAGRGPFETASASAGALSLSQPLLRNFWIDADRLAIFINKKELQKSEADFRDTLMSTITQVETAYLRLIQANENVTVQQKALELAERTLSENKKKVEVGAMAPLEAQQAEAQAAASRATLLRTVSDAGTQQRVLKSLLSDDYTNSWMNVIIQPKDKLNAIPQEFDLQDSWRKALAYGGSPTRLQQLRMTVEENNARVRLQQNQLYPEMDLTGSYGYSGTGKEFSDAFSQVERRDAPFWSIGAQMSIPLSQTAARNNLKAAKASRDQQKLSLKSAEQSTLVTIENDIATARIDYASIQATHEARLYAEAALEAEQKKYENGKSTQFEILGLQAKLTSARFDEVSALATYNVDLSTLSYDEGSTFDRLQIKVEDK